MSRETEAGTTPPGAHRRAGAAWPLMPLALLASAVVAALLASEQVMGHWLAALATVLLAAGGLASGALWASQRSAASLREARLCHQALAQWVDLWQWQTDAEHRLVQLQPPQRAPASCWVEAASSGTLLWERFNDAEASIEPRMRAHAPLSRLRVRGAQGAAMAGWWLRGLPRFDQRGHFVGYYGVAEPSGTTDALAMAQQGLEALWQHGPLALCQAGPDPHGPGLVLQRANPAACGLLGLAGEPNGRLPWAHALAALPDGLRQKAAALQPGQGCEHEGQALWLTELRAPGTPVATPSSLLLAVGAVPGGDDSATRSLAAEHASFAYTISHDLRAPIRVVEGFARIVKEDYAPVLDRVGLDHLDRVLAAAARMNQMIDALLSLSKLSTQPLARQPVNLSQLAGWVLDELRRTAPERQVAVHVAPGLQASGDPTLLRLVLENLLGNAWKYSAKVAQAEVHFEQVLHDGRTAFVVRDNGAGFDMRFADKLFGVFQRLHSQGDFPGHGVGLASVRRIVRRHGGEVWAESEPGQGARFYFTLKG